VRRLAVTALAVVGLLAVGVVALLEYISDPLIQSSRHSTYAGAEAAGLFTRGWLPVFVPRSSTMICEVHSLDTNEVCATLSVNPADLKEFKADLLRLGFVEIVGRVVPPRAWCASGVCQFAVRCEASGGLFRGPSDISGTHDYFAINHQTSNVCYWKAFDEPSA